MPPDLQKHFDKIEIQRISILDACKHLTPEQINAQPTPGKWSVAETLSHIIAAERMSTLYIQKKIQGISDLMDSGLLEEVKLMLLKVSQRLPGLKFKAPPGVVKNTTQYRLHADITSGWNEVRRDLRLLLEKIPDSLQHRMIYKHPFVGYLNVKQALQFFYEHIHHHGPQLKQIIHAKL